MRLRSKCAPVGACWSEPARCLAALLLGCVLAAVTAGCGRRAAPIAADLPVTNVSRSEETIRAASPALPPASGAADETRSFDFGKVIEGSELRHTFAVRNTAAASMQVVAIKKSCGCETAKVSEGAVVGPGALLEVDYSLSKYGSGEKKGQLIITTDSEDESLRRIELKLRAEVQPKVWATPAELELVYEGDGGHSPPYEGESVQGGHGQDARATQLLRVESVVPGLLDSFKEASTNRGNVVVELAEKTAEALTFRVAMSPDAPWGTSYDLIYLAFNNRERPSLHVRVRMRKGHPLAIIPATLKLPYLQSDESGVRTVRIFSPAGSAGPFRITKVDCPQGVRLGEIPQDARHSCDIDLTFVRSSASAAEEPIVFYTEPPGASTLIVRRTPGAAPNRKDEQ